jgi:hypothetical protein
VTGRAIGTAEVGTAEVGTAEVGTIELCVASGSVGLGGWARGKIGSIGIAGSQAKILIADNPAYR